MRVRLSEDSMRRGSVMELSLDIGYTVKTSETTVMRFLGGAEDLSILT